VFSIQLISPKEGFINMDSDKIVRCTATEWTRVPTPTTGIYSVEFADAERELRENHIGGEAKNWQSEFRVMGDVAVVVETDGLHQLAFTSVQDR
jgi:hypothetical protein